MKRLMGAPSDNSVFSLADAKVFFDGDNFWKILAYALWALPLLASCVLVEVAPLYRSVTTIYHAAAANWWAHQPVYSGPTGFNYLPAFLVFFSPFHWLPLAMGEMLWRWTALAGICCGLWSCTKLIGPSRSHYKSFAIATLIALPICISALRNGQSSAHLGACLVLAAGCLHRRLWGRAALWFCLSLVCKPLGIVAIGLAFVAFPPIRSRLIIGVSVVFLCPFLFAPSGYAGNVYAAFTHNIFSCFDTGDRTFADINGILLPFGVTLTGLSSLSLRIVAAIAAASSWHLMDFGGDARRSLFWLALTASYIMLFTPMNEANSYVMLAPALGLWALWYEREQSNRLFRTIVFIALSILLLPDLVGLLFGETDGNQFAKFWNPLMTLVFMGIVWINYLKVRRDRFANNGCRTRDRHNDSLVVPDTCAAVSVSRKQSSKLFEFGRSYKNS